MAWTDPAAHIWTTGELVTSASMNTYIEANLVFLGTVPACRIYNASNESITNNTATAVTFGNERYKTVSGMHSTSVNTSRAIATSAGIYMVAGYASWANTSVVGYRKSKLIVNNATSFVSESYDANASVATDQHPSGDWLFAVNDYVELNVIQTSGGALNLNATVAISPELSMRWTSFT